MQSTKMMLAVLVPLLGLGACTSLSDQDRALLTSANQNAEAAKQQAAQANATAQQALQTAQAAQSSATAAAGNAKSADEKADRMFQRSLRK